MNSASSATELNPSEKSIILFDGVCNLCNGFVQFIIRHDKKQQFIFGALQSEKARELISEYHLSDKMNTVVLIENNKAYSESTAVLRIAKRLNGMWKITYGLIIIPKFIRDFGYSMISKYRYRIFGQKEECMVPAPALKKRFLE